jgi:hypothetical protein
MLVATSYIDRWGHMKALISHWLIVSFPFPFGLIVAEWIIWPILYDKAPYFIFLSTPYQQLNRPPAEFYGFLL